MFTVISFLYLFLSFTYDSNSFQPTSVASYLLKHSFRFVVADWGEVVSPRISVFNDTKV